MSSPEQAQWYLVQSKPRQDARAEAQLRNQGFECYRPVIRVERLRDGKRVEQQESLFPGYLFIRLCSYTDNWYSVRSTRGVSRLVSFADMPLPVPEQMIDCIRQRTSQLIELPAFQQGSRVSLTDGPFKDLQAVFARLEGHDRAVILLTVLQRVQAIRVPVAALKALA
ncbi:MAG: transcription/translation regulatory transformer protein RfaH [Gammaproteobacteria bacterium HGW-Gammaproteobacteria-11]|nr:MAG: transcription/translation regulatory transformer protein RfaH [Gammaproteobacteria bacterium HGW-Gammaproteobacteria-11]